MCLDLPVSKKHYTLSTTPWTCAQKAGNTNRTRDVCRGAPPTALKHATPTNKLSTFNTQSIRKVRVKGQFTKSQVKISFTLCIVSHLVCKRNQGKSGWMNQESTVPGSRWSLQRPEPVSGHKQEPVTDRKGVLHFRTRNGASTVAM